MLLPFGHHSLKSLDTALELTSFLIALAFQQALLKLIDTAEPPTMRLLQEKLLSVVVKGHWVVSDCSRQPEHSLKASFVNRLANAVSATVDRAVMHIDNPTLDPLLNGSVTPVHALELDLPDFQEHLAFVKAMVVTHREPACHWSAC